MICRRAFRATQLLASCLMVLAVAAPASAWAGGAARVAVPTSRVVGGDVYGSAVAAAERAYPGWNGVHDVVIASGSSAALSDAAVASSLCWAYDAPLLLTSKNSLPTRTRDALAAIVSANASVTVHVVGSSSTIAAGAFSRIRSAAGTATVEQPWKSASRYSLAVHVAQRVREVAAETGSVVPSVTLVANGSDPGRLWDAAAASAVSRHTGVPILLTGLKTVPLSTASALAAVRGSRIIAVGGTATISNAIYAKLGASERWGGTNRFATAASVASHAALNGYSSVSTFGVAVTIPNSVVGAGLVGARGGVLLLSGKERLNKTTWSLLAARASTLTSAYAFGGASIANSELAEMRGAAAKPWFASGAPGRYVGKKFRVTGWVGGNTTSVALYVHGKRVRTATVKPWGRFNFTSVSMPVSSARVWVVADNPDGPSSKSGRSVKRLKYPSATCIVIDKSDFRLYWVKRNRLVKAYPIAIGRAHMETPAPATWKILAKYHTSPGSVYGPRKMRLFRKRGGRFVFSAYGIHGTNQPWVIGTKASHGCIRMYNRDVRELFPQVPMGTMVFTRS